ncbi:MAG: hypothetical protein KA974_02195 [Saprospiraceae bacterium]|nr:hypothetical protein [Saprospiraceae bacterium]MBP7699022.1 hypothetical protein [Saprospiraceae bacterium]
MQPHIGNLVNACALVLMGVWAYFEKSAPTALIPVFFGIVLFTLTNHIRVGNKNISHVAVIITFLLLLMLIFKPLRSQLAAGDNMGIIRTSIMIGTSVFAMITFMKSFRDARIRREKGL